MWEKNNELEEEKNKENEENKEKWLKEEDILSSIVNKKEEAPWIEKNEILIKEENQIIYDMNIKSIDDLVSILTKNEFDFLVVEPLENYVRISFKKDSILKLQKYIRYSNYSSLLINIKKLSSLDLEKTDIEQKWTWKYEFDKTPYEIIAKTVPTNFWENIFFKIKKLEVERPTTPKQKKKIDLKLAFSFLTTVLFVSLVVGGWFLSFIVFNAKTVDDVSFFYNLWINLNQINSFLLISTTIIFSILVFVETILLIIFLFKALLTKKTDKRKKTFATLISIFAFLLTFWTWTTWMTVDKAIRALPNWQEMSYWNIQLYDNDLLTNKNFDKGAALITDYTNIIGPITIKFDISYYARDQKTKWFTIKKYIWNFWWEDQVESLSPELIKDFTRKWTYNLTLKVEGTDRSWKEFTKDVSDTPKINVWYLVWIKENRLNNWGKTVEFDASELKVLWDVEWYLENDMEKPAYVWEVFRPSKIYFNKEMVWMQIDNKFQQWNKINKIFIISWEETNIWWSIEATPSIDNDLEYTFVAKNLENTFWNWFIEKYKWNIEGKDEEVKADITDLENSSKIVHNFESYWEQKIKLTLTNTSWNSKEITKTINIPKNINLDKQIEITDEWQQLNNIKYDKTTKEYFVYDIWIPTNLKLDATQVRSDNPLYVIDNIKWKITQGSKVEEKEGKSIDYNIEVEWSVKIEVNYTLKHRKNENDIVKKVERIYIEPTKKDVQLDLQVKSDSEYAPALVSFDASLSQVKWENIVKFIYDYWDWTTPEERDAKNYWRRYLKEWIYDIKLTVVTENGWEYSVTKKLILKPKSEKVAISVSLKEAPVWQEINFSSTASQGQITSYYWDFWDGTSSTDPNPSHAFNSPWKYNVKLTLDFANNNVLSDEVEVNIKD
jgi:hypothetical protein